MKRKILIFGINGFTGTHLKNYLHNNFSEKYQIYGCDIEKNSIEDDNIYEIDLQNYNNVNSVIKKTNPNYIINCTGLYNYDDYGNYFNANILISINIFNSIFQLKDINPRVLIIGSAAEYGLPQRLPLSEEEEIKPTSTYGIVKASQTLHSLYYAKYFDLYIVIARPFNILGPGLSSKLSISNFCLQIYKNRKKGRSIIRVGNLDTKRDFIDIQDTIRAYMDILLYGDSGEIYNICSGKSYSIK